MGFFSRLFGKKEQPRIKKRKNEPDVVNVQNEDEKMNWAMEKARLTIHFFEQCLVEPRPGQQYFSIKVKIEEDGKVEHIWLNDPSFDDDGNLFGVVGNAPLNVKSIRLNQKIGIDRKLVSDWMIIENGRLIGGYTIRVLRDQMTGKDLQNFDRQMGGMLIDDGEDYFLPDDSTPEGAIVKLEKAFDRDDLEGAIACKDFQKEAELMLAKMGKENLNDEIIEKTAEVLKLSFIKSLQENGMPKFKDLRQAFPKRELVEQNHMIITEVCYYPDGGRSKQRLNVVKTEAGWRVLSPVD